MRNGFITEAKGFINGFAGGVVVSTGGIWYLVFNNRLFLAAGIAMAFYLETELYIASAYNHCRAGRIIKHILSNTAGAYLSGVLFRYKFPEMISTAMGLCLRTSSYGLKIIPFAIFMGIMFTVALDLIRHDRWIYSFLVMVISFIVGGEDFILNVFYHSVARTMPNGNIILLLVFTWFAIYCASNPSRKVIK